MKKIYYIIGAALLASCGNKDVQYDASGVFEATEVIVSAKGQGEILSLTAEEGEDVKAGDELGVIDTLQLSIQRRQLLSTKGATASRHLDVTSQVAAIQQQIKNAQAEKARFEKLLAKGAATQKQVDDIKYQISVLQRQLTAAKEQITTSNSSISEQAQSADAQIALIDEKIHDCHIVSTATGTVINKFAETGEFAAPGKPLFKVTDISDMKLRAYVTADQLTSIKVGQKVTVYADEGKSERKAIDGTITWISQKAEFTPKTIQTRDERANLVYAIKISVKNTDGLIKSGMYGDVAFK